MEAEVFPAIGAMQIQEIKVAHIKALLDGIMTRGVHNTAEKIREWTAAVFDYAAMLEITESNPARILRQYIPPKPATNRPALPREELTEFYRRLIPADVEHSNRIGLLLIMLVFVRNTELRGGRWEEIDFQAATWTIPAERMKHEKTAPKPPHVIPLADWPLELLAELREITGHTPYLFPSRTKAEGFISENTLGKIMNGMGYKGRATPHGFRALASSILNEQGFNPDAIERQLAHVEEDRIRAAYNRADYMDERREMMQWYSLIPSGLKIEDKGWPSENLFSDGLLLFVRVFYSTDCPRSISTPTSRTSGRMPGLTSRTFTHAAGKSFRISEAMCSARVSSRWKRRVSRLLRTASQTSP